MDKVRYIKILVLSLVSCSLAAGASADEQDFGLNVGVAVSKKFGKRFEIGLEEEMRTKENSRQLDRLATGLDASFQLVPKIVKVGVGYTFIADYDEIEGFSWRHRLVGQVSAKHKIHRLEMSLRGRYQLTYKDESVKSFKWNPKSYLRGKFELSYKLPKIPLTPFASAEVFYELNNYKGNTIDNVRYEAGGEYKFNKKNSVSLSFRYDDEMNVAEPLDGFKLCAGYQYKF